MSNIEILVDFIKTNLNDLIICHNLNFDFMVSMPISQEKVDRGQIYFEPYHCYSLVKSCLGETKFDGEGSPIFNPYITISDINFAINYLQSGYVYNICYGSYELVILYYGEKMYYLDSFQDRFINGVPSISEYRIQETNKNKIIRFLNACLRNDILGYCEFVSTSSYFNEAVRRNIGDYLNHDVKVSRFETNFKLDIDFLLCKIVEFPNTEPVYFDDFNYRNDDDMETRLKDFIDQDYKLSIIRNFENIFNRFKVFFCSLNRFTQNTYLPLLKSIFSKIEETISIINNITPDQFNKYLKSHFNELNMIVKIKFFKDTNTYQSIIDDFKANLERIDEMLVSLDESLKYSQSEAIRDISIKNHGLLSYIDSYSVFEIREMINIHLKALDDIKKSYYKE